MWKLGGGVATEVTNTGSMVIDCCSQFIGADADILGSHYMVMPVLTKKTIEGATMIEDCQILIAVFRTRRIGKIGVAGSYAARANPVGDTIGGKWVVVPA